MSVCLPRGAFTLSLDFELVWGSRDLVADPAALVAASEQTRDEVFEPLLALLVEFGIRATWATVGHLFLDRAAPHNGRLHPDLEPPTHEWWPRPWLHGVPAGVETEHPAWYGRSLVEKLVAAGQEVGSHSFTHPIFGDPGCSRATAVSELRRCLAEAEALGITLRSFVFPRNVPGHLDVLAEHGIRCWRPPERPWYARLPKAARRALHLAEVAAAATPPSVLPRRGEHGLWGIPGSAVYLPLDGVRRLIPMRQRVTRAIAGIDHAAAHSRLSHLYLHPINLASDPGAMLGGLRTVFCHAARLRDRGVIDILSMDEVADVAEESA